MKTTLVIMAAGVGSRFGGGIKQLVPIGPNGEIIMDYSVHDAIAAGFQKIVFIIRKDIERDFRQVIGDRIERVCRELGVEVAYTFQALDKDLPVGAAVPVGRTKPWGTGQAVLTCKGVVDGPFAVINADDYYGKEAFRQLHAFLTGYTPERPFELCMAGFVLKNTLSEYGGVTRGICQTGNDGYLTDVVETSGIEKTETGARVGDRPVDPESYVSMNMWGLTPEFIELLEEGFREFFSGLEGRELTAEYLLPIFIGQLLRQDRVRVKVLPTCDKWFGVTYSEDREKVIRSVRALVETGVYRRDLFSDLG